MYHGEIQCDDVYDYFKSQEDLSEIFGFPEDFNIECQIATLLDDPTLSSIIDTALYEEIVNSVDDEMIMQSSDLGFLNQDMREPKVSDKICSNFTSTNSSMIEVDNILDEITTAIDSKRNPLIHGSMVDENVEFDSIVQDKVSLDFEYADNSVLEKKMFDQSCATVVEIDLNNNLIHETDKGGFQLLDWIITELKSHMIC